MSKKDEYRRADVMRLFRLDGKVALITGVTGHLGAALAEALTEAGASVVVTSRRLDDARSAICKLPSVSGGVHHAVQLDHTDEDAVRRGFDAAVAAAGGIAVLVCCGHEPLAADWTSVTAEQFNRQLTNATGYFLLARMLHAHARSRGTGASIVLLGSMYGVVGSYPDVYAGITAASPVAYHALKGGIVHMTRHLAVYWAKDGVRVNCLSPGPFPSGEAPRELVERLKQRVPMGRIGQPGELKGAVVFLASDASSFMTGHNLLIDGGWTAW